MRARLAGKGRTEDPRVKGELTRVKERQRRLAVQREEALTVLRREPELIMPGEVTFLAHALVVPSSDPEDHKRHDKGRAGVGDVELIENEWAKACNLRDRYWLYMVYDCASPHPRLLRVQDPFAALLVRARGGVVIDKQDILATAEPEEVR